MQQHASTSGLYSKVWRDDRAPTLPRSRPLSSEHHYHHQHHAAADWAQQRSSSTSRITQASSTASPHLSRTLSSTAQLVPTRPTPGNNYYSQPLVHSVMLVEVLFRVFLAIVNIELEHVEPFTRKIHENELWLYKNPRVDSYVSAAVLWVTIIVVPLIVISLIFLFQKEKGDFSQAVLSFTLSLGFTGVLTNILKIIVGRPRPDYFYRCFPDGNINFDFECTGDPIDIRDGKKSFPSGHASLSFSSFGFIALYLAGKFHTFSWNGKGQSWKLFFFILPLSTALTIAVSRTCDYHHHWQDVTIGSALGFMLTFLCYRHYYPPLDSLVCHKPYTSLKKNEPKELKTTRIELSKWT